jgi:hypothetical protein
MGDDNTSISTRGECWGQAEGCERTLIRSDTHMACTEAALGPVGVPRYCEERTNALRVSSWLTLLFRQSADLASRHPWSLYILSYMFSCVVAAWIPFGLARTVLIEPLTLVRSRPSSGSGFGHSSDPWL